jgi:glycosyltransferase involved in cell wall biosynthesis
MRDLGRWLRNHRERLDVVYVMSLRQEAYTVLGALNGGPTAVVLRPQVGDVTWLHRTKFGGRIRRRLGRASAIIAATASSSADLRHLDVGPPLTHRIANGVHRVSPRRPAARFQARAALAAANHDLGVAEYAPVAVALGRLTPGRRIPELIEAWQHIAERWPAARLWLVGDGPLREAIYERIVDRGLHHHIALPGTFDDLADVFQAANVYLADTDEDNGNQFLLEAMAAGLPAVAADSPDHRELVQHAVNGMLVPMTDPQSVATAIGSLFDAPQKAEQLGRSAQQMVQHDYPLTRCAAEHLRLFRRLLQRKETA